MNRTAFTSTDYLVCSMIIGCMYPSIGVSAADSDLY